MGIKRMINKVKGKYSGKEYYASEAIRISNPLQAASYWENGLEPLDIYPTRNPETRKPVIVFVFNRVQSKPLFDLWCKKELT